MFRKIRIIPAVLSAAIVVFGFGYVAVARADTPGVSPDVTVEKRIISCADLNLERAADAATLYGRKRP